MCNRRRGCGMHLLDFINSTVPTKAVRTSADARWYLTRYYHTVSSEVRSDEPDIQPATAPLRLPLPMSRIGRPNKRRLCSFVKRCQPFDRLSAADKDWLRLNWLCEEEAVRQAVREGSKLEIDDILSDVACEIADERACCENLQGYFTPAAWNVVLLLIHDVECEEWPCSVCKSPGNAPQHWIQCDHCLKWLHYTRAGITANPKGNRYRGHC